MFDKKVDQNVFTLPPKIARVLKSPRDFAQSCHSGKLQIIKVKTKKTGVVWVRSIALSNKTKKNSHDPINYDFQLV
jgi:hypothetical protein